MKKSTRRLLGFSLGVLVLAGTGAAASGCKTSDENAPRTLGLPQALTYDAVFVVCGGSNTIQVINAENETRSSSSISLENTSFPHWLVMSKDRSKLLLTAGGVAPAAVADAGSNSQLAPLAGEEDGGPAASDDAGAPPPSEDAGPPPPPEVDAGVDAGAGAGPEAGAGVGTGTALIVMNAATGTTIKGAFTGGQSYNAVFGGDESEVWTTLGGAPGKALVLLTNSLSQKTTVDVENGPSYLSISANGLYAFVANSGSGSVSAIDTATKKVIKTVGVGAAPFRVVQAPNGLAYVESADKKVTAIDTTTLAIRRTYDLGFTAGGAAYAGDGTLWVTDFEHGRVAIFDGQSGILTRTIDTGAGAYGITFSADGKSAYVANQAANTVSIIDVAQRRVRTRLPVGSAPNAVLFRQKTANSSPLGDGGSPTRDAGR